MGYELLHLNFLSDNIFFLGNLKGLKLLKQKNLL